MRSTRLPCPRPRRGACLEVGAGINHAPAAAIRMRRVAPMRAKLMQATRSALKAQDKQRLSALRLISAAIQERDIASHAPIPDADIPALLQKMIKQRREALAIYQ